MREREFSPGKPAGQIRVLCLGDSITFGYGLPSYQTWPKDLEKLLVERRQPPLDYFVINSAGPANNTNGQADFYGTIRRKFGQKLVIVGFCLNDVTKREFVEKESSGAFASRMLYWRYGMRKSYLVALLDDSLTEGLKKYLLPLWGKDWVSMYPPIALIA
jgi:lysophospholipase L1-like esterase